jgi:hypothetical protein
MWIAELLDNSWSDQVISYMTAFEDEMLGDRILQFYVFLWEHVGYTKEAIPPAAGGPGCWPPICSIPSLVVGIIQNHKHKLCNYTCIIIM